MEWDKEAIALVTDIDHTTIINWVKEAKESEPDEPQEDEIPEITEIDELPTKVGHKKGVGDLADERATRS